jgi:hypothetical protein
LEFAVTEKMGMTPQQLIFMDILHERERQDDRWGGADHDRNHTVSDWKRLILEHLDKANQAAYKGDLRRARERFIEVAALAVAAVEMLDKIVIYDVEGHRR